MRVYQETRITQVIIAQAIKVHRKLGPGLFEKTYEECLVYELRLAGLKVEQQKACPLVYEKLQLSNAYRLDLLVEGSVIVELKSVEKITALHITQVLTYLRFTSLNVGLIINFNTMILRHGIKRVFNKTAQSSGASDPQESPEILSP